MKQEMTFIKKNGMKIQGLMYLPEKRGEKLPAVIFSHGFGSNFRELMHHGEGYAKSGICCLFFDFCGGGLQSLSDGVMPEMTLRSECEDLQTVLSCVKELDYVDPERIFLQGESMGGLVSALTAAKYTKDIRALILWYPAFCIPEDARIRLEKGEREVFGVTMNEAFDAEAANIHVSKEIQAYPRPVLIIHGTADNLVPIRYSEMAVSSYADAKLIAISDAGHGFDGTHINAAREISVSFVLDHCGQQGS